MFAAVSASQTGFSLRLTKHEETFMDSTHRHRPSLLSSPRGVKWIRHEQSCLAETVDPKVQTLICSSLYWCESNVRMKQLEKTATNQL